MKKITPEHVQTIVKNSKTTVTEIGEKTITVCLTLPNGFELAETYTETETDFNLDLSKKTCLKRLEDKIYLLETYVLCTLQYIGNELVSPWENRS